MQLLNKQTAEQILKKTAKNEHETWIQHSKTVAEAAFTITQQLSDLYDPQTAYCLGLLHDIGKSTGGFGLKHVTGGYNILRSISEKAARICLTHSFPNREIKEYQGKNDLSEEEFSFLDDFLNKAEYDYYDELIQLCDSCAGSTGFIKMEERWIDITIRKGINEYTIPKWKKLLSLQEKFRLEYDVEIYAALKL